MISKYCRCLPIELDATNKSSKKYVRCGMGIPVSNLFIILVNWLELDTCPIIIRLKIYWVSSYKNAVHCLTSFLYLTWWKLLERSHVEYKQLPPSLSNAWLILASWYLSPMQFLLRFLRSTTGRYFPGVLFATSISGEFHGDGS